ncbi:MAG: cytochrome c [Verrucomicrobiales bacterium]|nr:cytochrome c [Verrucomicrobiales bacterium]
MSDHHTEDSENPLASLIGKILLVLFPLSLVIMLGFVGAAFIQGGGYKAPPPAPVQAVAAVAAKASPAASAGAADGSILLVDNGPPTADQMALGKTSFMTCAACHGMDGKGMQVGPQKMAPSFEGSELLLGNVEAPLAAVIKGIHKVPTSPFLGQMTALGAGLDDNQIASVLTYARNSFGNKASAISPEQAAAARAKYSSVDAPMGLPREDLEKIAKGN